MHDKLLSHRIRGFGAPEHTAAALRTAVRSAVPYLEVDTRASRDGEIFLHHDAVTRTPRLRFAVNGAHALAAARHPNGEPLLRLEDALRIFSGRTHQAQRLCLDIKDHGFEQEHLRLVQRAGLESHTHFISWIPQTLVQLSRLGAQSPLLLSHANLLQYPLLAAVTRPWRRSVRRFGRFVLMGRDRHEDELDGLRHGYQHSLVCERLPESLLHMLAGSGGGICVHYALAGRRLGDFCSEHGLQLWVFTARGPAHFTRLAARRDIAVVFTDDAPAPAPAVPTAAPAARSAH